MTIEDLIEEYKEMVKICYHVDYSDKKSVRKNNKAVDRMYAIINHVKETFGTEGIVRLGGLLEIEEYETNQWIAPQLLEKTVLDKEAENKALSIIEKVATGDDVTALGFQYWLKDWKSKRGM